MTNIKDDKTIQTNDKLYMIKMDCKISDIITDKNFIDLE